MSPTDDLGPLLVPPPSGKGLRYGQGRIISFDTETFENEVEWLNVTLTNLPVMSGVDSLTLQPNDFVGLLGWQPGGGAGSWWIMGKIIIPGTAAAAQAISFLQTELAAQITREIFARGMQTATVADIEESSSDTFTDLPTFGPQVSLDISDSGTMLVLTSARIILGNVDGSTGSSTGTGLASFAIAGATTAAAEDRDAAYRRVNFATHNGLNPHVINDSVVSTKMTLVTGLNEGNHTVTMKYRRSVAGPTTVSFGDRTLVAIGL